MLRASHFLFKPEFHVPESPFRVSLLPLSRLTYALIGAAIDISGPMLFNIQTMCGRYKLTTDRKNLKSHFPWLDEGDYFDIHGPIERGEIFPGTLIPVINNQRMMEDDWWTIRDTGWNGKTIACINAKAETIARLPMFRDAFKTDRVLIPATGLYEWQEQPDGSKKKFEISFGDSMFAFAGIARECEIKGEPTRCAVIITTNPNEIFREIHNTKMRQAVVIRPEDHEKWLDPMTKSDELKQMLQPLPASETRFREV
jgi:putative SOS response-associated peptidase YedK